MSAIRFFWGRFFGSSDTLDSSNPSFHDDGDDEILRRRVIRCAHKIFIYLQHLKCYIQVRLTVIDFTELLVISRNLAEINPRYRHK